MGSTAPITWLITEINKIVASGAAGAAGALSKSIAPLVAACFGIYLILVCVNYLRGAETDLVADFIVRMLSVCLVITFGLNASVYASVVIPIVTGLGTDLANAVSGGSSTAGALDTLALHYFKILEDGYNDANAMFFPANIGPLLLFGLKAVCILLGLVPFLVLATIIVVVANVGSFLVAMVGPLFFACLLFPATRQYFSAWLNTVVSYALMPLFVAVIALISVGISKAMLSTGGSLDKTSLSAVFFAMLGNIVLLFLLREVKNLASSLSAGGINASVPGSIGSAASALREFARGSAKDAKAIRAGYGAAKGGFGAARDRISNAFNSIRKAG